MTDYQMNSDADLSKNSLLQASLSNTLAAAVRYVPLLTGLLTLGLLLIYSFAQSGLLGTTTWQLLAVAGITLGVGLLHLLVSALAARGRAYVAYALFAVLLVVWSVSVVLLWESAWPVALLIAWTPVLAAASGKLPREGMGGLVLGGILISLIILWFDGNPPFDRASSANQAATASVLLVGSTVLLYVIGTLVIRIFPYRSLQSRLITAFVLIMAVPVLFTTAVSALNAFTSSEEQFRSSLEAVSSLRTDQIDGTINMLEQQLSSLQQGSAQASSIVNALDPAGQTDTAYRLNVSAASTFLRNLMVQYPGSHYEEVFVMDPRGNVALSTYSLDQGLNFSSEEFFREGASKFHASMTRFAGQQNVSGEYKLIVAAPLYGSSTADVRGVVAAVVSGDAILSATGPVPGLQNASVYLVNDRNEMVNPAVGDVITVSAWPVVHTVLGRLAGTSDTYTNYRGQDVFGYAVWEPSVNAAVVAEVPRTEVYNRALGTLLISALVGIFGMVIAAITALSTARNISDPISRLAGIARTLATGNLAARAESDQRDEVGNLAVSFNAMAEQLQGIVGNLEQRVAERTEALEQQSLRLRTAAEVARDAASAPDLDTLLDQAARLIMDRFGFYHAGIFLLDEKKQYAVLRASPSAAGKEMLERRHKLRVGEQGIVGRVAATGEPRIALDTGVDAVYFSNPLLPNTHSEMALPLKTAEGTIGIVDIQSDQPEAFTQEDIAIVQIMADQLATAIQRANLLQQVQRQLEQLEQTSRGFTEQTWRSFAQTGRPYIGYRFDNVRMDAIRPTLDTAWPAAETAEEQTSAASNGHQTLEVPIRLRGQVIGTVELRLQSGAVPDATSAMIQQIADRLATALENARLLEDSLRRANKERAIGEITAKISSSVNMRNVLQTAVEELGRAIPGSEVVIQFRPDTQL